MKYKVQLILQDGTEKFLTLEEGLARKVSQMLSGHPVAKASNEKGEFVFIDLTKVVAVYVMAAS